MWVKKYEAESLEAALAQVKRELGADALILSTQQVKRGWFRRRVEVMAALGAEEAPKAPEPKGVAVDEEVLLKVFPHRRNRPALDEESPAPETAPKYPPVRKPGASAPAPSIDHLDEFRRLGFSEESAKELTRRLIFDYPKDDRHDPQMLPRLKGRVAATGLSLLTPSVFDTRPVWTALGVGGAGKTSLLVKLALRLKKAGMAVTLVGGDRRKVVGHRELATYARLIQAPFQSEPKGGNGIQLIDSPALSLTDEDRMVEIGQLCRSSSVLLVLDGAARLRESLAIVERARRFNPAAVAFTRFDLVDQRGAIFDILKASRLPLLGVSLDDSFKTPFKFFDGPELGNWLVGSHPEKISGSSNQQRSVEL